MKEPTKPAAKPPKFKSEDEEADWWASAKGRLFLKQQSSANSGKKLKGSRLVSDLNRAQACRSR
jgi:hypothetical protein